MDSASHSSEASAGRKRRRTLRIVGVLAAMAVGYLLSPYAAAARLAQAARAQDVAAVEARVDLPALRQSLARQVVRLYTARDPRIQKLGSLERGVANAAATAAVSAVIGDYLTPEALTRLAAGQLPAGLPTTGDQLAMQLPALDTASVWRLVRGSRFENPVRFSITVGDEPYRLGFALRGMRWRLSALELPPAVIERLVATLEEQLRPET